MKTEEENVKEIHALIKQYEGIQDGKYYISTYGAAKSCAKYATQQCAIVAAEKDKEIERLTLKKENMLAAFKSYRSWIKNKFAAKEAECQRLREIIDKATNISTETGRYGCTYGDTDYDSMSVAYGYNLAVQHFNDVLWNAQSPKEGGSE